MNINAKVDCEIPDRLNSILPIGLNDMDSLRLMNRIDTKYILAASRLPDLF